MTLGRLTLTLFFTSLLGLSTVDALAQEAPSEPKDKPKTEGEEEPGQEQDLEKLKELAEKLKGGAGRLEESSDELKKLMEEREKHTEELRESSDRLQKALSDYRKFLNEQRFNAYESIRINYLNKQKKGELRKINQYENSRWVEMLWTTNDDLEFGYMQDALWFGSMIRKRLDGEYFYGFRLYLRKEGNREVPFVEVLVDYDYGEDDNKKPVLKLFDITQEEYEKIIEETKDAREGEQWYFQQKVLRTYKSFMREYFENSEHSHYTGTFGDIIAELKKRINDSDIDVKKWLVTAIPGYKGYSDSDKVPIQRPKKKKPEEKK
jgi:exonuclease VII small subunit